MTLSNQSQFPRFFSARKMTYRNLANSGLRQAGIACPRKMTFQRHYFRKMTYWGLTDSGLRQAGIGQAPVSHLTAPTNRGR
jgi:hypothetical protein